MQRVCQFCVHLQTRFTACEYAHLTALVRHVVEGKHLGHDLLGCHLSVVRKLRVAPRAAEVTSAETNEHRRNTAVRTFALQGKEYFVDFIQI